MTFQKKTYQAETTGSSSLALHPLSCVRVQIVSRRVGVIDLKYRLGSIDYRPSLHGSALHALEIHACVTLCTHTHTYNVYAHTYIYKCQVSTTMRLRHRNQA